MLVTELPQFPRDEMPKFFQAVADKLPSEVSIRRGAVPGFAKQQIAIYDRAADRHVAFDADLLTEETLLIALSRLGWSPRRLSILPHAIRRKYTRELKRHERELTQCGAE
jgi:hypothetical protein